MFNGLLEKGEEFGFYRIAGGAIALHVKNSSRAGIYIYNKTEKNWMKDEELSEECTGRVPSGKYFPFLPESVGDVLRMQCGYV